MDACPSPFLFHLPQYLFDHDISVCNFFDGCGYGCAKDVPGKPLDKAYTEENLELVEKGVENLLAHIETVKKSGISPVVCINNFYTDTKDEVKIIRERAEALGARVAVSKHWEKGGDGAIELAEAVVDACEDKHHFRFLYEDGTPLKDQIARIATDPVD